MKPGPHLVCIKPIRESDLEGAEFIPDTSIQAHAIIGRVLDVGPSCEEDIPVDAYVIFRPWRQLQIDQRIGLWTHWMRDNYILHEDDILMILVDW